MIDLYQDIENKDIWVFVESSTHMKVCLEQYTQILSLLFENLNFNWLELLI